MDYQRKVKPFERPTNWPKERFPMKPSGGKAGNTYIIKDGKKVNVFSTTPKEDLTGCCYGACYVLGDSPKEMFLDSVDYKNHRWDTICLWCGRHSYVSTKLIRSNLIGYYGCRQCCKQIFKDEKTQKSINLRAENQTKNITDSEVLEEFDFDFNTYTDTYGEAINQTAIIMDETEYFDSIIECARQISKKASANYIAGQISSYLKGDRRTVVEGHTFRYATKNDKYLRKEKLDPSEYI